MLGAQTQGMIGYWLVQALQNALPGRRSAACLVSRTLVRADDPAFARPTKFVGPVYDEARPGALAAEHGWEVRPDGAGLAAGRALPGARRDRSSWPSSGLLDRPGRHRGLRRRRRHPRVADGPAGCTAWRRWSTRT